MFRHVTEYANGSIVQGKSNMLKKTFQKHLNKLHEKVGDAGMGYASSRRLLSRRVLIISLKISLKT